MCSSRISKQCLLGFLEERFANWLQTVCVAAALLIFGAVIGGGKSAGLAGGRVTEGFKTTLNYLFRMYSTLARS